MIEGVYLREVIVHRDDRGFVAELFSENFGDRLVHEYRCFVLPGVAKAFHAHVGSYDSKTDTFVEGQTDRFSAVGRNSIVKVGLIDLRGSLGECEGKGAVLSCEKMMGHTKTVYGPPLCDTGMWHYFGIDGTARLFREVWPYDEGWIEQVGESPTFLEQQTVILHSDDPQVLFIPPGVAHGIYPLSEGGAEIVNSPTVCFRPECPDELRMPADSFGFQWRPQSR